MMLPLVGGFNDGKYIEPNGRTVIRMACPAKTKSSHHEDIIGFEYENYILTPIVVGSNRHCIFLVEGEDVLTGIEALINGYKKFNKIKALDLSKSL